MKTESTPLVPDKKGVVSRAPTCLCLTATYLAGMLTTVAIALVVWSIGELVLKHDDDSLVAANAVGFGARISGLSLDAGAPFSSRDDSPRPSLRQCSREPTAPSRKVIWSFWDTDNADVPDDVAAIVHSWSVWAPDFSVRLLSPASILCYLPEAELFAAKELRLSAAAADPTPKQSPQSASACTCEPLLTAHRVASPRCAGGRT